MARALTAPFVVLSLVPACCFSTTGAATVRRVETVTNDLIYDSPTGRIFASTPGGVTGGNSVRAINPVTGAVLSPVYVGGEPVALARSDDGRYLYVALSGSASVRRYDIATGTAGPEFGLGVDPFTGTYYPEDIAVMPGNSGTVAVSRRNIGYSPRHEGVAIYDNGVRRPVETPGHTGSNRIAWGESPGVLYGINNETTEYGVRQHTVSADGVRTTRTYQNVGLGEDFEYAAGRLYGTNGRVLDAATGMVVGTFPARGLIEPDPTSGRMFILTPEGVSSSRYTLNVYDLNRFTPITSVRGITITGSTTFNLPSSLIRWGADGLAFRTSNEVILIDGSDLVPEPTALGLVALAAPLMLRRRARAGR